MSAKILRKQSDFKNAADKFKKVNTKLGRAQFLECIYFSKDIKEYNDLLKNFTNNMHRYPEISGLTLRKKIAKLNDKEMLSTFNCGIGMVIAVKEKDVDAASSLLDSMKLTNKVLGEVSKNKGNKASIEIV